MQSCAILLLALRACNALTVRGRRTFLSGAGAAALGRPLLANAAGRPKVVVVGGAGFVGTQVSQLLVRNGASVVSVSRRSAEAQADIIKYSDWVDAVSADASKDDLSAIFKGAAAVVSCVGVVPGGKNQLDGNGAVNVRIADAAKKAQVPRFVYISVASAISDGPGKFIFGDYMKGKAQAEAAVKADYSPESSLIIRPAVISGGPPGPPPPPGVPPVPVDAVARAAVAGALGKASGVLDGAAEIQSL